MKSTGEVMGVDYSFGPALTKALAAANLTLARGQSVLLSIADRDKAKSLALIRGLVKAGCKLYATEGTAAMLRAVGAEVTMTPEKLGAGHPNVVDVISDGTVQAVINTVSDVGTTMRDGFYIRAGGGGEQHPLLHQPGHGAGGGGEPADGGHGLQRGADGAVCGRE